MNWFNIFKKDKKWQPERRTGWKKPTRGTPVKEVGGERQWGMEEDKTIPEDDEMEYLAEQTREDLMDIVMEKVGSMSKKDLIDFLVKTRGKLDPFNGD